MIKPINSNIFLERDPTESTFLGMEVSEKAQVGNYKATVKHCSVDSELSVGDRVHVPYYNVNDYGDSTIAKESDLFAKEDSNGEYQPINNYVKVRKCENDHVRDDGGEIALYMTEHHIEFTNWVEIIEVGSGCRFIKKEHIGLFCVSPEDDYRLARIGYSKDMFMLREDCIEFLTAGDD